MATTRTSPATAMRIARRSPEVQALQSALSYVDIYTGSLRSQYAYFGIQPQNSDQDLLPHAHPEPPARWQGPRGFGVRHVNDSVPFSLWSEDRQRFRSATVQEMRCILETYNAERVVFLDHLTVIETFNPPKPIPLTVACVPTIFVPPGQNKVDMYGTSPCVGPRVPDPCPHLAWGKGETPTKSQMAHVISVLAELANIQRVNFFPTWIVVELVYDDGRTYLFASLPAVVAGLSTTYHHSPESFMSSMRDHGRERLLDPSQHLPGPQIGPLPQDGTNYLREPLWGTLTPGVRVSTGLATDAGTSPNAVLSTTCGVLLRKGATAYASVANHGFLGASEVFHPAYDGDKIGDIVDRYPELDIAMVQLTPANSSRFSNQTYFQAEPSRRLAEKGDLVQGTWFEVDGMSTGLLSFLYMGDALERPVRSPGHPEIPFLKWRHNTIFRIFGATNPALMDGLCGAPFVEVGTGNVAGFFHLANGDWAECAALDDLVAEGWDVV